jgi:hypothetical protein
MKLRRMALGRLLLFVIFIQGARLAIAQVPVQAWVQRYEAGTNGTTGRKAIGVDTNGNVFVSGSSWNGSNYGLATLAYSNSGVPLWTNRYDAGGLSAQPCALAVSRDGNIFVIGSTFRPGVGPGGLPSGERFATVAYSGNGTALWTNSFLGGTQPAAIAVGQSGTVFVTGNNPSNMTTLAYSSAGALLWTNQFQPGSGLFSSATSMALDDKENVFVAGYVDDASGDSHYAVVAYSGGGVPLWTNEYIGPVNISDAASAVVVDGNGNVFVTGGAYNTNGFYDYVTVAYSGAGVPLWTNRYSSGRDSTANAIAVDTNGNIFVTGQSSPEWGGFPDYATVAYSAAGSALWTNRYHGPAPLQDSALAVAADGRGHVVVTGFSSTDMVNHDYATIWYNTSGAPLFTKRYNGPANGPDQPSSIAVDFGGNVFVTGTSWNGTSYDFATIKYAPLQPVPLLVQRSGDQIVLNWTNAAFGLQSAPTLSDTFTNVPGATSPYTNRINGGGQFFRLISM